jgi:HPt (histidine-containing phosphotransfer) domain-containing protein
MPGLPDTLPGANVAGAFERVDGNEALYIRLLKNFVESHGEDLRDIRKAVSNGENQKALFILHNIKGIAGLLSLNPLRDVSVKLERELASNVSGSIGGLLDDLDASFMQVEKTLEEMIPLGESGETCEEVIEEVRTDIPGIIAELEALVERGSIDSRRQLALLRKALPDDRFSNELDRIKSFLDKFDFKEAKDSLRQLIARVEVSG